MNVAELTERQRVALEHPLDRTDGIPHPAPRPTVKTRGKWRTILEVSNEPGREWTWMASVSRQRAPGGRPYTVKQWKPQWRDEADAILRELLEGVGAEDIDVMAKGRQQGLDLEGLAGYHLWRTMTPEELLVVRARARKSEES